MSQEEEKAKLFVSRLLSNPTLITLNPLQKEEKILSFIDVNATELLPTLSSSAFFSGESWASIRALLLTNLKCLIDELLIPGIQRQIYEKINFGFISLLRQNNQAHEETKENLFNFTKKIVSVSEGRKDFSGSYNAISYQIVDKYIDSVFDAHSYIHFELTKVQRLKMSKDEIKDMIKVSLILRPAIYMGTVMYKDSPYGIITQSFAEKVEVSLIKDIPSLPAALVKSAIRSNISFEDHKYLQATSRMTSIINSLARSVKPDMKVDRGASTPEKSWFSIAKRNYKYFGWDIKMLDELYRYSAENDW